MSPPAELRHRFAAFEWASVGTGESGAAVWRLDGPYRLYLKCAHDAADEAARLTWLARAGIPVPELVDAGDGWLVTAELAGRPAHEPWPAAHRERVVDTIADLIAQLHGLRAADCPFDRRLAVSLLAARANAAAGRVALDDLDDERAGRAAHELVASLDATTPATEDVVVGHGDPCLPNVLIDPDTLHATGFVDVGRVGLADRYNDLAIATRSIGVDDRNSQFGPAAAQRLLTRLGADPDDERIAFYRLLDEFF